jgi:hypothetical protein
MIDQTHFMKTLEAQPTNQNIKMKIQFKITEKLKVGQMVVIELDLKNNFEDVNVYDKDVYEQEYADYEDHDKEFNFLTKAQMEEKNESKSKKGQYVGKFDDSVTPDFANIILDKEKILKLAATNLTSMNKLPFDENCTFY